MNKLNELPRPVIFAHRGACAYAPENTLASFRLAAEMGADAIELDTKLTADGQMVVIHDQTVDRTTGGSGKVGSLTLAELKKLDAGNIFGNQFTGEPIPTLEEVFETVGKKVYINVEITNYASPFDALPDRIAGLVKKCGLEDWVIFSSFQPLNLIRMKRKLPDVPVAQLALDGKTGLFQRGLLGKIVAPDVIHPYSGDTDAKFIQKQHENGRRVHVWTVNDPADMRRLFAANVDGIFTDDPKTALQIRSER